MTDTKYTALTTCGLVDFSQIVADAIKRHTLPEALARACLLECRRAVRDAVKRSRWDTCFLAIIEAVIADWIAPAGKTKLAELIAWHQAQHDLQAAFARTGADQTPGYTKQAEFHRGALQLLCTPLAEAFAIATAGPVIAPINMILFCPACGVQHIDAPDFVENHFDAPMDPDSEDGRDTIAKALEYERTMWTNPPHRSHLCHACKHVWRPADVPTNGVAAIKTKGSKDAPAPVAYVNAELAAKVSATAKKNLEALLTSDHCGKGECKVCDEQALFDAHMDEPCAPGSRVSRRHMYRNGGAVALVREGWMLRTALAKKGGAA